MYWGCTCDSEIPLGVRTGMDGSGCVVSGRCPGTSWGLHRRRLSVSSALHRYRERHLIDGKGQLTQISKYAYHWMAMDTGGAFSGANLNLYRRITPRGV